MSLSLPSVYCNRCGFPLSNVRAARQEDRLITYSGHCNACNVFCVVTPPDKFDSQRRPTPSSLSGVCASAAKAPHFFSEGIADVRS